MTSSSGVNSECAAAVVVKAIAMGKRPKRKTLPPPVIPASRNIAAHSELTPEEDAELVRRSNEALAMLQELYRKRAAQEAADERQADAID